MPCPLRPCSLVPDLERSLPPKGPPLPFRPTSLPPSLSRNCSFPPPTAPVPPRSLPQSSRATEQICSASNTIPATNNLERNATWPSSPLPLSLSPSLHRVHEGLARLEEEDGDLTEVEVHKVLGLVGHVGAKVAADNAVPGRVVLLVKLLRFAGGVRICSVPFRSGSVPLPRLHGN